mmetsp:Transcript_51609/g.142885  ORF Transcript_51609/g.142885 Transcript_51609/m.142885 type:complete len:267 (+) Transcript_51609:758-1558(+)
MVLCQPRAPTLNECVSNVLETEGAPRVDRLAGVSRHHDTVWISAEGQQYRQLCGGKVLRLVDIQLLQAGIQSTSSDQQSHISVIKLPGRVLHPAVLAKQGVHRPQVLGIEPNSKSRQVVRQVLAHCHTAALPAAAERAQTIVEFGPDEQWRQLPCSWPQPWPVVGQETRVVHCCTSSRDGVDLGLSAMAVNQKSDQLVPGHAKSAPWGPGGRSPAAASLVQLARDLLKQHRRLGHEELGGSRVSRIDRLAAAEQQPPHEHQRLARA